MRSAVDKRQGYCDQHAEAASHHMHVGHNSGLPFPQQALSFPSPLAFLNRRIPLELLICLHFATYDKCDRKQVQCLPIKLDILLLTAKMATLKEAEQIITEITGEYGYLDEEMMDDIGRYNENYRRRIDENWLRMENAASHSIKV
jgi:hypothetical protein